MNTCLRSSRIQSVSSCHGYIKNKPQRDVETNKSTKCCLVVVSLLFVQSCPLRLSLNEVELVAEPAGNSVFAHGCRVSKISLKPHDEFRLNSQNAFTGCASTTD